MEKFDEFMMLLKYEFHWDITDVVYIPQKVSNESAYFQHDVVTEEDRKYILELSTMDSRLYEHCKTLFYKKLQSIPREQLLHDLSLFKHELISVAKQCSPTRSVSNTYGIVGTQLGYYRCDELTWVSTEYAKLFTALQHDDYLSYQ